ncbi:tumor necrosis factor receptor superfamily member 14-like [Nematolebias whitei]|uniref:tumor necrosis factor receptor superfamily member 14-like n=1 Tax=Nematolebias whitei TaxID=451745 RepID=UPI0018970D74|nr:tumor necrosis factor receptor superfamily member 14-like [Nematolebias whitei]
MVESRPLHVGAGYMMITAELVFVCAAFTASASGCRDEEFTASNGLCCPMCNQGTVVGKDCTVEFGTRCVPCEARTFMNQPNGLKKCFPCTSCDPGDGLFADQECSTTADTVCEALKGFFCKTVAASGCSEAEEHSLCKPGQRIKEPGTNRSDTVCEDCQDGYFSSEGLTCSLWTKCSETQTEVKEGSSVSDVVCRSGSTRHHYWLFLYFLPFLCCLATVGYKQTKVKLISLPSIVLL